MNRVVLIAAAAVLLNIRPAIASDLTQMDATKIAQFGIAAYHKGDYPTAIRYLSARAKMQPEDANVYYYLGNCYLQNKQNSEAAHLFSAAVKTAPTSQAGKYSLTALETLSSMPKAVEAPPAPEGPDPAQTAASKDALMNEKPLDKAFNDAVVKIKSLRQTLKSKVDHVWLLMQEEMQALSQKNNPTYAIDLEKLQREAENKVQDIQTKELRQENRIMAPEKIDVRAIPQLPSEKIDDTKTALGSLLDYFKPDKPYDPFGTDITPELSSKFLSIKDVFGELATYQGSARRLSKQVFFQLKNGIEVKQDMLDQQLYLLKQNLISDVVHIKTNYNGQSSSGSRNQQQQLVNMASFISGARIPRKDNDQHLSPMETEIHQAVERSKKRIKELEETYYREVDGLVASAKEKLGGMIAQTGQMNSQLQKPSGNIQLVPLGTDMYTRNYVNFNENPNGASGSINRGTNTEALRAEAKKMLPAKTQAKAGAK